MAARPHEVPRLVHGSRQVAPTMNNNNNNNASNISVLKVNVRGEWRRVALEESADLSLLERTVRGLDPLWTAGEAPLVFRYEDSDGDYVTIGSSSELKLALKEAKEAKSTLRLHVMFRDDQDLVLPASPVSSGVPTAHLPTSVGSQTSHSSMFPLCAAVNRLHTLPPQQTQHNPLAHITRELQANPQHFGDVINSLVQSVMPSVFGAAQFAQQSAQAIAQASTHQPQQPQQPKRQEPSALSPEQDHSPVHEGVICDGCNLTPIRGTRYRCSLCESFDLCPTCYARRKAGAALHDHTHVFLSIESPLQSFTQSAFSQRGIPQWSASYIATPSSESPPPSIPHTPRAKFEDELEKLGEMGFHDAARNRHLLDQHSGDLIMVVASLLRE